MKKFLTIFAVVMVIALVLSSVFTYKTNTYEEAFSGVEKVVEVVSSVSEKAVVLLQGAGEWTDQLFEHYKDKFGATDYDLPIYYRRLMGDTSAGGAIQVMSIFLGSDYRASSFEYVNMARGIYEMMGKDFDETMKTASKIFTEETALALYYYDLYNFFALYEEGTKIDLSNAKKDEMFAIYCRIEGTSEGAGPKLIWRWNSGKREEYAMKYLEILASANVDMDVWKSPWNNIAHYEFGVFVSRRDDGTFYLDNRGGAGKFNVKDYGS